MKAVLERSYPYAGGSALAAAYAVFARDAACAMASPMLNPIAMFGSMFNLGAVLTGFLFTVYILAIAPSGSFIERIFTTRTFKIFRRYVIEAMCLGASATVVSWPLGIMQSFPDKVDLAWHVILALWVFVSVSAILAFFRVGWIFFILAQYSHKD